MHHADVADVRHIVRVDGWELAVMGDGGDPDLRVRDRDLAERLEYSRPRDIRKLIERLLKDKKLNDSEVCATVSQTSELGGRPATEYWLSEAAALKVIAKSETAVADAILDEVIRVYMAARRGLLPSQQASNGELLTVVKQQAEILAELVRRVGALETGAGTISLVQVASIRQQVDTIARGRARAGLSTSKQSACSWIYNRIFSVAGWTGTGRKLANMPADRYATVLAELDALRREVAAANAVLTSRQLTLARTGDPH